MATQEFEKFYYLTVVNSCSSRCPLCLARNPLNPEIRTKEELKRAFDKMRSGAYQAVIFPPNFLEYDLQTEALQLAQEAGVQPILQLHRGCWNEAHLPRIEQLAREGVWLESIFDTYLPAELKSFEFWEKTFTHVFYTFVPTRRYDALEVLGALPEFVLEKLYFYAPPETLGAALFYSCDELEEIHRKVSEKLSLRPPRGVEIWNSQLPAEADLEPLSPIAFETKTRLAQVHISAVVITRENKEHLLSALSHLLKQRLNRDFYEVVVVDDGSTDGSFEAVRDLIKELPNPPNFKYILYPRQFSPLAPIGPFRSGPSRNLGAKHAAGAVLVFLDSQLLCPNHFLDDVLKQHRTWDVVQYQRFFLKKQVSSQKIEYARVDLATDSQTSRGGYWERFYLNDSLSLPQFWSYTSFSGLSIKAELFKKVGGCLRDYKHSALEGAFFGHKLSRLAPRWKLRNLPLYQLFQDQKLSRRRLRRAERELEFESARMLYLNTLSSLVYRQYFTFLGPHHRLRRLMTLCGRWWLGRALLKPLLKAVGSLHRRLQSPFDPPEPMARAHGLFQTPGLDFVESPKPPQELHHDL